MSDYPRQVEKLKQAILSLPGAAACEVGLKYLEQYELDHLSLPGEFADLPHVAFYRTDGALEGEVLIQVEMMFRQSKEGWVAAEFLAWWARDQSRSGERIQFRALALPPEAYERQLGSTLKFVIEAFLLNPAQTMDPILVKAEEMADDISDSIALYRSAIDAPVEQAAKPELW